MESNEWDYEIDPDYSRAETVPSEGIVGAYRLVDGQRVGDLHPNPAYQPSTLAKMLDRGRDDVLDAYAALRAGAASKQEALATIAAAEIIAFEGPNGQPWVATVEGGRIFQVFTSEAHLKDVPPAPTKSIPGHQLAEVAALGIPVQVNPHPEGGLDLAPEFFAAA